MDDKKDGASTETPESGHEDEVKTDEQVWNELATEEAAAEQGQDEADASSPPEPAADDSEDEPEPEPSEADAEPESDTDPDPLANASPEVREMFRTLEHKLASTNGRLKALRKKRQPPQNDGAADPEDAEAIQARQEELGRVREEYADVVGPLVDELQHLQSKVQAFQDADQAQQTELLEEENRVFLSQHPDGMNSLLENPEAWNEWLQGQPQEIHDAVAANNDQIVDGDAVAGVVSLFKAHLEEASAPADPENQKIAQRRQLQKEGARSTRVRGPSVTSEPPADANDPEGHWAAAGKALNKQMGPAYR